MTNDKLYLDLVEFKAKYAFKKDELTALINNREDYYSDPAIGAAKSDIMEQALTELKELFKKHDL